MEPDAARRRLAAGRVSLTICVPRWGKSSNGKNRSCVQVKHALHVGEVSAIDKVFGRPEPRGMNMRYFQRAAAAILVIGATLAASSASAATQITAAGGNIQVGGGGPYDNVPAGTLSIKGLGTGITTSRSRYTENVELAGTGFFAGMTGLGTFVGEGVLQNLTFTLQSTVPDQFKFEYSLLLNQLTMPISYTYDQVFGEDTSIATSPFNGINDAFRGVVFTTIAPGSTATSYRTQINATLLSNDTLPFVPIVSVTPAVPEPASWAMMMVGLGAVGYTMRRRKKVTTRVSFA